MRRQSRFPQGGSTRQIMGTQATGQTMREVRTEDELRAAITEAAASGGTTENPGQGYGATIVIAQPINITAPVVIPEGCIGLTVTARAKFAISAVGVVAALFDVRAALVTIRDVLAWSVNSANMFTRFVRVPSDAVDVERLSILHNYVQADQLFDDEADEAASVLIDGNYQRDITGSGGPVIHSGAAEGTVANNYLDGADAITLDGGGRWTITGNNLNGGNITTTASDGGNRLAANADPGTKTLHADDIDCDAGAGSGWTTVFKTADQTVNNTTTLQTDDDLQFPVEANKSYRFKIFAFYKTGATADFVYELDGPAGASVKGARANGITGSTPAWRGTFSTFGSSISVLGGAADDGFVMIEGFVAVGGTAGTVAFQWRQNNNEAVDTGTLIGSTIEYAEVA